jgi:hypothetical protein
MRDFRVEERHYFRENKSIASRQKAMVLQERLYFGNIPLSNCTELEMVVEEEIADVQHMAKVAPSLAPRLSRRTVSRRFSFARTGCGVHPGRRC